MFLELSAGSGLTYDYRAPESAEGLSFACFNPLTGDKSMWEGGIGPALIREGHGLLTWNLRGQAGSPFGPGDITPQNIVGDAVRLLRHVAPPNPVYLGLSIGGLYAAQAHLAPNGAPCRALVLINTLRESGARLAWINDAVVRMAEVGGLELLRDAYSPLLMNEAWQAANRKNFLTGSAYTPIDGNDGALHLLKAGAATTWDLDWAKLAVPVLNITGQQDRVFRDPAAIEKLLARMENATALEYPDAGHMVPVEAPDRLAQDILDFAKRV